MKSWRRTVFWDTLGVGVLLPGCLGVGIFLNQMRAEPLAMTYSPPDARLDQAMPDSKEKSSRPAVGEGEVGLAEMKEISTNRTELILDARPEVFYRFGHIPSAVSLPRDDFEKSYQSLVPLLQGRRDQPMIVYCASMDCQDSQMVADALGRLGYPHVRLFRGGWSDWESANLPEDKQ